MSEIKHVMIGFKIAFAKSNIALDTEHAGKVESQVELKVESKVQPTLELKVEFRFKLSSDPPEISNGQKNARILPMFIIFGQKLSS